MNASLVLLLCGIVIARTSASTTQRAATTECGLIKDASNVQVHGEDGQDGLLPWNVQVYGNFRGGWRHRCEGTLITPTHVVTTAYFVNLYSADRFQLAARKLIHNFYLTEPSSQLRGVKQVIWHEQYNGTFGGVNDIGVLVADRSFDLSTNVAVACVDWTGLMPATSTDVFIAAAWVSGEVDSSRELIASQSFSLVDNVTCRAQTQPHQLTDLADKICARQSNNDTCGDSWSSGLMLKKSTSAGEKHYLWGVLSIRLAQTESRCFLERLSAFTDIRYHLAWLRQHIENTTRTL